MKVMTRGLSWVLLVAFIAACTSVPITPEDRVGSGTAAGKTINVVVNGTAYRVEITEDKPVEIDGLLFEFDCAGGIGTVRLLSEVDAITAYIARNASLQKPAEPAVYWRAVLEYSPELVPLVLATGHPKIVRDLLSAGADPNSRGAMTEQPPLFNAIKLGQTTSAVQALLEYGVDPNHQDGDGNTALHHLAGHCGCLQSMVPTRMNLKRDRMVLLSDQETYRRVQSEDLLEWFLENGADPHIAADYGAIPFDYAEYVPWLVNSPLLKRLRYSGSQ